MLMVWSNDSTVMTCPAGVILESTINPHHAKDLIYRHNLGTNYYSLKKYIYLYSAPF